MPNMLQRTARSVVCTVCTAQKQWGWGRYCGWHGESDSSHGGPAPAPTAQSWGLLGIGCTCWVAEATTMRIRRRCWDVQVHEPPIKQWYFLLAPPWSMFEVWVAWVVQGRNDDILGVKMEKPEMTRFDSIFSRSQILTQCISSFIHPFVAFWPRPYFTFFRKSCLQVLPLLWRQRTVRQQITQREWRQRPKRASPKQGRNSRQSGVKRSFYWRVLGKDMWQDISSAIWRKFFAFAFDKR